jgi:hypothetical protein
MNRVQEPFKVNRQDLADLSLGDNVLHLIVENSKHCPYQRHYSSRIALAVDTCLFMDGIESIILFERPRIKNSSWLREDWFTDERNCQMVVRFLHSPQDRLALLNVGRHRFLSQNFDTSLESGD